MARFLLVGGLASSLVRFRGPLIDAALAAGHDVICAAGEPDAETTATLAKKGVAFHAISFERTGTGLFADVRAIFELMTLMRQVRPDVVMGYTVKPALYSVLASYTTRIGRPYAMLTGLGYALTPTDGPPTRAARAARAIARAILPKAVRVFFHNGDDRALCESTGLIQPGQGIVVSGSGVDLESFPSAPLPDGPTTFLFVARLLRDKGIEEFVQAATLLHKRFPHARFRVVGEPDGTERSVTDQEISEWSRTTPVKFVGAVKQPWSEFAASHVFVLPSTYGEGLPRTLLEAMAVGRAIVTTDMPGCREAVVDHNGFLVAPKSIESLYDAMSQFLERPDLVASMGARGRELALTRFDAKLVAAAMLDGMDLLDTRPRVLHIITGLNTGGAEASLVRVVKATQAHAAHVVVSLTSKGTRGAELEALGVKVVALDIARGSLAPQAIFALRRIVREQRTDCVQGWMYHGNLAATLLGLLSRRTGPVFWNVRHALDAWQQESRTLQRIIQLSSWASFSPRAIVYNSARAATQHVGRGFRAGSTVVVKNGVDTSRFAPNQVAGARLRAQLGIPTSAFVIGMIARVDPLKDHDAFLAAVALDRADATQTWYLLAGTDTAAGTMAKAGALDARVDSIVAQRPDLATRIVRLGERQDIPDVLNACDVVTLPSRSEGSPNAVAEAMACGVPCVVTDVGDAAQLVRESGIVVPIGDPSAIVDAWRRIRRNAADRRRRGEIARSIIESEFTTEREARAYVTLWRAHTIARGAFRAPGASRVLVVTTASVTLDAFLLPFADHFRSTGWNIDCAAAGVDRSSTIRHHFDRAFEMRWSRLPISLRNFAAVRRIRAIVNAGRYDIVHVHTPVAAFLTRFALRRSALRHGSRPVVIYTAHGFHADATQPAWKNAVFRLLERIAAPWSDHLVTINAADRAQALSVGLSPVDRLHSHPGIGVDLQQYRPISATRKQQIRESLNVADARDLFVVVGEFSPRKRQIDVVAALAALERKTTERPTVLFVGDGRLRAHVERRARELGVSASTRFLGHRADVNDIVASSDALLLCSTREGLPRCVLEACAAGVPVIGTAAKGTVDILQGDRGLLVPVGNVEAIAAAMMELRQQPEAARRRAERARTWVESRCDLSLVLSLHDSLYARALGRAPAASTQVHDTSADRRVNSAA